MLSSACVSISLSPSSSSLVPPFFSYCFCFLYLHMFHQISLLVSCPVHGTCVQQSYARLQQTMLGAQHSAERISTFKEGSCSWKHFVPSYKERMFATRAYRSLFPEWKNMFCKLIIPCPTNARCYLGNFYLHPCLKFDVSHAFLGFPCLTSCQHLPIPVISTKCHLMPLLSLILHSLWASYHRPYFFYYRNLLILIMPPTSSSSYSHYIIHISDKLIIKHSFNLSFATRRLQWLHSLLEAEWHSLRA